MLIIVYAAVQDKRKDTLGVFTTLELQQPALFVRINTKMNPIERIISLIAPHECLGCGVEGLLLCNSCSMHELIRPAAVCMFCSKLSAYGKTCPKCIKPHPLNNIWVTSSYERLSKELVQQTKYQEKRAGVVAMADAMFETIPVGTQIDAVVGVPTITSHVRGRGFDHTHRMARLLAAKLNVPCLDVLVRLDQTAQQGGGRTKRVETVSGNMRFSLGSDVNDLSVLLVDDVVTTGATITEAAKVLKRAGTKKIYASIFARA